MEKQLAEETPGPGFDPAALNGPLSFVLDVQKRLESQPETYQSFLASFQEYQKALALPDASKDKHLAALRTKVVSLLQDHPDLSKEFEQYFAPNK
ncbi:Paired amphipathic helix [Cordyceps militaris]|uniref:Paired amphipathic helix n=1 Tax=Cordyceps militaris TaxID=73501 RepID=A0A2H4SH65_CORMI|nr:Paired amphipathic helix [Cordyceps militaris]